MMPVEINKHKIKSSFSKAAPRYDMYAAFQREVAEELMQKLIFPHPTSRIPRPCILDIGCGTGFLTHGLTEVFSKANIFGCDIAHEMIDVTRGKELSRGKKTYLITADGGVLPYKDKAFDMVASNLTYQWIHGIETAFSEAHRVLKPGGIFAFSTLGPETLKELRYCYAEASAPSPYPLPFGERERVRGNGLPSFIGFADEQAIQSTMKSAGFKTVSLERKEIIKTYPDMWALLKTMKSIGAGNPFTDGDKSLARGSLLKNMAEVYKKKFGAQGSEFGVKFPHPTSHIPHPNYIYATYEVMFIHAKK